MLITNHVHWRAGADDSNLRMDHTVGVSTVGYTVAGKLEVEWRLVGNDPGKSVDWTLPDTPLLGLGGDRLEPVDGGAHFTRVAAVEPASVYKLTNAS